MYRPWGSHSILLPVASSLYSSSMYVLLMYHLYISIKEESASYHVKDFILLFLSYQVSNAPLYDRLAI